MESLQALELEMGLSPTFIFGKSLGLPNPWISHSKWLSCCCETQIEQSLGPYLETKFRYYSRTFFTRAEQHVFVDVFLFLPIMEIWLTHNPCVVSMHSIVILYVHILQRMISVGFCGFMSKIWQEITDMMKQGSTMTFEQNKRNWESPHY